MVLEDYLASYDKDSYGQTVLFRRGARRCFEVSVKQLAWSGGASWKSLSCPKRLASDQTPFHPRRQPAASRACRPSNGQQIGAITMSLTGSAKSSQKLSADLPIDVEHHYGNFLALFSMCLIFVSLTLACGAVGPSRS
ncbi:hypothetical protein LZ32DRAFT_617316 [Colletotrichum eremochloae]|nr:hypothetical protein LZ32DRAFT_617316 [Colletotrichum eremochloae]